MNLADYVGNLKVAIELNLQVVCPLEYEFTNFNLTPYMRETLESPPEGGRIEDLTGWFKAALVFDDANDDKLIAATSEELAQLVSLLKTTPAEEWGLKVEYTQRYNFSRHDTRKGVVDLLITGELRTAEVMDQEAILIFEITDFRE